MHETGPTARLVARADPAAGSRRRPPRRAVTLAAAIIVLASAFACVMAAIFRDPERLPADPLRVFLWCAGFAVVASAVSVLVQAAYGKAVPLVLVVCSMAMWALLPATILLAYWLAPFLGVFVLVIVAPLSLAAAAWVVILRGRVARGTALLLVALLGTAGGTAIWIPALATAIWLPVVLWHLALSLAAAAALAWDLRRDPAS